VDVCADINQTSTQDIKEKLITFKITNNDIHKIFTILTSQTKDVATTELFTDAEKCLSSFIALHGQCLLENPLSVQTDLCADLQYMLKCEKMKTYLSLAQLLLYGPMSPVDYVMCDTVRHDCLQRVVRTMCVHACLCVHVHVTLRGHQPNCAQRVKAAVLMTSTWNVCSMVDTKGSVEVASQK